MLDFNRNSTLLSECDCVFQHNRIKQRNKTNEIISSSGLENSAVWSSGTSRFPSGQVPFQSHLPDGQGIRQSVNDII